MSGSSQSSGDQGIDQILAQIRKVIADEPQPARLTAALPQASMPPVSLPVMKAAVAPPRPVVAMEPAIPSHQKIVASASPAFSSILPKAVIAQAPANHHNAPSTTAPSPPSSPVKSSPRRPPDDLSDLVETEVCSPPSSRPDLSKAATTVADRPVQSAVPLVPAPNLASAAITSGPIVKGLIVGGPVVAVPVAAKPVVAQPAVTTLAPAEKPATMPAPTTKPAPVASTSASGSRQSLPAAVNSAAVPAAVAEPLPPRAPPPPLPSAAHVAPRPPETPPLLGARGLGGKAPMSLANMVANGSISMPSGVPSSIQPPDVVALPSTATAVAMNPSSALGDLAAGLAASGQSVQAMSGQSATAIPAGLEDQILERLRPTVRQWLEANAESLTSETPKN